MPRRKLEPHPFPDEWLEQILKSLWLQVVNLQDKWWRRAVSSIQSVSYLIQQKFALTYELQEAY